MNTAIATTAVLAALLAIGMAFIAFWSAAVNSQPISPYSDFEAMTVDQLNTLQVKLTYVGEQEKALATVAFTSDLGTLDLSKFLPYRRSGINYGNDEMFVLSNCSPSTSDLYVLIQNVGTLPNVTPGGVAGDVFLSFALFNTVGGEDKAFEAVLNEGDTRDLFAQITPAIGGYAGCFDDLASQWRAMGLGAGVLNPDSDGDELPDVAETNTYGTDPYDPDTDSDGMPDGYEAGNLCLAPLVNDAVEDPDSDGVNNVTEMNQGTDPCAACTDRDGDTTCRDPVNDQDDDGCTAAQEAALGANFSDNQWYDAFDVPVPTNPDPTANGPRNRKVDMGDVLAVLFYAFAENNKDPNANGVDYDSLKGISPPHDEYLQAGVLFDRSPGELPVGGGVDPAGAPNGKVDMGDVLGALAQAFVVNCSG